ncbi:MAG: DUF2807 domain-containing protein [Bacteroidia bacterium]|nr:DUF2807 domain-containing protein [Bacteroidia bacterium]NNF31600.1 DUF2807 domain-containing protein [Flavobacteriaceae bacterium]MBT8275258.1 DUF2807 domain-containing protein [Bacteroidia bacterium]NNJ83236.1 DUF2807 domain-containing protein [Flavobacteriaceae bacterium]NNK53290.1 DUF2807 domain-containing protein [Flavobacteriaceae bacterium]
MKKLFIIVIVLCFACDSADAPDCFRTNGAIISLNYDVATFTKIRIEDNVNLSLMQGDIQEVQVEAGENLIDEIKVDVLNNTLVVRNKNTCDLVRDYETINVFVTAPEIVEIRNGSVGDVVGKGILEYDTLKLISDTSGGIENVRKSGDFYLNVNCVRFVTRANGFSRFFISGSAREATLEFADEIPYFEGPEFLVDDLRVFQRSANIMKVNPINSIKGEIRGTGDIIAVNRPKIVDVEEYYTGRLIFED